MTTNTQPQFPPSLRPTALLPLNVAELRHLFVTLFFTLLPPPAVDSKGALSARTRSYAVSKGHGLLLR